MISIVISSYQPLLLEALKINVCNTIGVPYELIVIENKGIMGIGAAYNIGASRAKYDLLCFIHEDIKFATNNWGNKLIYLFNSDKELALAGLAGSKYKPNFVTGWTTGISQYDRARILQYLPDKSISTLEYNPDKELYTSVVTLDGVCLFIPKDQWIQNKFNEELTGFHFYDLDLSLRISSQNKKVAVLYCIDVIHFSMGKFNDVWLKEAFKFHKNKITQSLIKNLPIPENKDELNRNIKFFWIYRFKDEDISALNKIKLYIINYKLLNKENFWYSLVWYSKFIKHIVHKKFLNNSN